MSSELLSFCIDDEAEALEDRLIIMNIEYRISNTEFSKSNCSLHLLTATAQLKPGKK